MSAYIINIEDLAPAVKLYGINAGLNEQQQIDLLNELHAENVVSVLICLYRLRRWIEPWKGL